MDAVPPCDHPNRSPVAASQRRNTSCAFVPVETIHWTVAILNCTDGDERIYVSPGSGVGAIRIKSGDSDP